MALILVGSDGSEHARRAARVAGALLGAGHDYLVVSVVHPVVFPPSAIGSPMGGMFLVPTTASLPSIESFEDADRKAVAAAEAEARATAAELPAPARIMAGFGAPGEALCHVAEEEYVDLVVVGSHGRGAASGVLHGSVSQHVMHHCHRPVLVVPPPAKAEDG